MYQCSACGRRITARLGSAFSGYRFPDDIIALAVRHSLRYRLSYADVVELLAERGITVDASTIYDWGRTFTLHFIDAARAHRFPVSPRWLVDETYLKITGRWRYLIGRSTSTAKSSTSISVIGATLPLRKPSSPRH